MISMTSTNTQASVGAPIIVIQIGKVIYKTSRNKIRPNEVKIAPNNAKVA